MGFRGQSFVFESPAAAAAGMIVRLRIEPATPVLVRGVEACELGGAREEAMGRVLAEHITADRDSPAFDYASMDGYAVRLADVASATVTPSPSSTPSASAASSGGIEEAGGITLLVAGEARIGCAPPLMPAAPGVVRIVTGAAIPLGADAVLKREDVIEIAMQRQETHGDQTQEKETCGEETPVGSIMISPAVAVRIRTGDNIRRRAENARAGDTILNIGTIISAAALGTLAAVGCVRPRVYGRLRVAVITTGDELVPPSATPQPYQVRNSNGPAVSAVLAAHAWLNVASVTHVRDDGERLVAVLRHAIENADAVILTGGVSVGHRDPVRGAVEAARAEVVFHGLPQRPGKPMLGAVATRAGGSRVPVFGLPGNPISAMVTCLRIVVPVLATCAGVARWPAPPRVALANPDGKTLDLWWHRLVRLDDRGEATLVDGRSSGDAIAVGGSDGFIEVPPHVHGAESRSAATYPFHAWPT